MYQEKPYCDSAFSTEETAPLPSSTLGCNGPPAISRFARMAFVAGFPLFLFMYIRYVDCPHGIS